MKDKYTVTVVSETHWDRAWYVPFQEFRVRLVRLIDRLLDLLERDPDFRCFMLDGQTVVLEDYFAIRPENRERVRRFVQEGRLQVGPWYVLVDEFLASPESMIRNLQIGWRMAEELGQVMWVGYTPDAFGHIAALPQILAGFDLDNAVFWRGMGPEGEELGTEFRWVAADGTSVLAIWLADGYHNVSNLGYPLKWGDTSQMRFSLELALDQIERAVESARARANTPALLLMNGIDHAEAQTELSQILVAARERFPDVEFCHGTLEDHIARVRAAETELREWRAGRSSLGEFNRGTYDIVLQGVYSTRMYLKQANHRVLTLLERYAEPLSGLAWVLTGREGDAAFLEEAWRWVLKNHPHDDICGCSVDQVHEEMMYRFGQAEQIGHTILRDASRSIMREVDYARHQGLPITLFNPLGWPRQEIARLEIPFDMGDPMAERFQILDSDGQKVPYQKLSDEPRIWLEVLKGNAKRVVTVALPVEVPAGGYASCYVQPAEGDQPVVEEKLRVCERGAENEFVRLQIQPDGSLTLTDKGTRITYQGLNRFEDSEDAGDEYTYSPCPNSQTLTTEGLKATITPLHAGPLQATFCVELDLEVPASLTEDGQQRSEERVSLPICSEISLYADRPGVYISTTVDNRARDHRLRALFPTPLRPTHSRADGHFAVIEREVDMPEVTDWEEDPSPTKHQRAFVDVSDGGGGLALLNRGLPEYEARREHDGSVTLCLTLLRCVGWLSRGQLLTRCQRAGLPLPTPGAQCLGSHTFEYAIVPHKGGWQAVFQAAYNYNAPLHALRADIDEGMLVRELELIQEDSELIRQHALPWDRSGALADRQSLVAAEPSAFVVSGLKRSEGGEGLIVRGYNITDEPLEVTLSFGFPIRALYRARLNEERVEELEASSDRQVTLPIGGHEVVTIEVLPQR
jgi:mannosylglycerate hydrolase